MQKKVGDASDSGLQFPLYTDVAAKGGLASMSQWAFRNVPSESAMYKSLFEWIKATRPEVKTIWGGVEKDFAHSNATFNVMKGHAEKTGFEVKGTSEWLLADTSFSTQVREMRRGGQVFLGVHAFVQGDIVKTFPLNTLKASATGTCPAART